MTRERGSVLLGMAGLIVVLAVMSGTVLYRSLDAYRSSGFHVVRLQATAAAEGAAVAWKRDPGSPGEALVLGDSRVIPAPADQVAPAAADPATSPSVTAQLRLPFRVEVLRGGRPVYTANYAALYSPAASPQVGWRLLRLEVQP